MKVFSLKTAPPTEELAKILRREFSDRYSYNMFGLDRERSIMVGKSAFVGAQISKKGNEITVHGVPPSTITTLLATLDMVFTGGLFTGFPLMAKREAFEREVSAFLKQKFN